MSRPAQPRNLRARAVIRLAVMRAVVSSVLLSGAGCVLVAGPGAAATRPARSADAAALSEPARVAARAEIVAMMARSATAWNTGDLDAFVSYYEPGVTTTFVGRHGVVRGRAAIREVYAPRFAPGGVRDSLSFENVDVDLLAPDVASVLAYYRLMRGDSTTARGPTSLVMRRTSGNWLIVHDHSS